MSRGKLPLILLACLLSARAGAFLPRGAVTPPFTVAPNPASTTVAASWNTSSSSSTALACGTTLGTYDIAAADNGTQISVTTHAGIVAGLTPSTLYYCQATSGVLNVLFSTTTTASPPSPVVSPSVPIVSLTVSASPSEPIANQIQGDTFMDCISTDNVTYVAANDNYGWCSSAGVGCGRTIVPGTNVLLGKFTSESPWTGLNVNSLGFGGITADTGFGGSWKLSGMGCYKGNLAAWITAFGITATGGLYSMSAAQLLISKDRGATWSNPKAPGSPTSGGNTPTLTSTGFFGSSTTFGGLAFIKYGADDGTLGYRVDNADAYAYAVGGGPYFNNNDSLYLARVPIAKLANQLVADWEFYKGGVDGSLDAAWSSNQSDAVAILSSAGKMSISNIQYMPAVGRYLIMGWYNTQPATSPLPTKWIVYESAHPWSAPTLIYTSADLSQAWFYPNILQRTALAATANGTAFTAAFSGGDGCCGAGGNYHFFTEDIVFNTH